MHSLLRARTPVRCGLPALIAALGLLVPAAAGATTSAARHGRPVAHQAIYNGSPAAQGQFPSVAWMKYTDAFMWQACSGTLVAPNVVLTAGHCVTDDNGRPLAAAHMTVTLNTADLTTSPAGGVISRVARVVRHPKFNRSTLVYDVALLILPRSVGLPLSTLAGPAQSSHIGYGGQVVAVGYGQPSTGADASPQLMYTQWVYPTDGADCVRLFGAGWVPGMDFCTFSDPVHPSQVCHGDSGGPLYFYPQAGLIGSMPPANATKYVLGVASFMTRDVCNGGTTNGYTSVSVLLKWIIDGIDANTPLPALGGPAARAATAQTAQALIGRGWNNRRAIRLTCTRRSATAVGCRMQLRSGDAAYLLDDTVAQVAYGQGRTRTKSRYTLRSASAACVAGAGFARCRARVRRGTM